MHKWEWAAAEDGRRWSGKGRTSSDLGLQTGLLDAYQRTRSGKNRRMAQMKGALMHLHPRRECFLLYQQQTCGAGLQYGGGGGCTVSKQWEGVNEFSKTFAGASSNSRSFSAEGHAKGAGKSLLRCDRPASLIAAVLCWYCRVM